ncbi:MAG: hypothetical protein ACM3X3_05235 [Betaproteobacteria bacterium]
MNQFSAILNPQANTSDVDLDELAWEAVSAAAYAILTERFKQGLTGDPRPDLPDHEYWEKLLQVLSVLDPEFAWVMQLFRLLRACLVLTQQGHLKLDISPVFAPPLKCAMTQDEFKERFLAPKREVLIAAFREVEKEI